MRTNSILIFSVFAIVASACRPRTEDHANMTASQHDKMHGITGDSSYAAMQRRGGMAMGVDQYTSSHEFEITPDGGRISLQRDTADSLGVAQIRAHMQLIQHAFQAGDFSTPAFVHQRDMPGTKVMAAKREAITYRYEPLPRGGSVVITTSDAEARSAIREFLQAQRAEHKSH